MKKIIPILTIASAGILLTGCANSMSNINNTDFKTNINSFREQLETYSAIQNNQTTQTALNKYKLTLDTDIDEDDKITVVEPKTLEYIGEDNPAYNSNKTNENTTLPADNENADAETDSENSAEDPSEDSEQDDNSQQDNTDESNDTDDNDNEAENEEETDNISTLYSLSSDIEDSCDEFCELKQEITNAILETQNIIQKIQNNEIELTAEQRLLLSDQSMQLKNLSRQLARTTNELSINLSELTTLLNSNGDIDNVSLKYLIILDNLINGNEMLQSGLSSLNMINQLSRMNTGAIPPNNRGRILYSFQQNDQPPIVKDYYIDENGEVVENQNESSDNQNSIATSGENESEEKKNVDTYKDNILNSNIDTYGNFYKKNIDTFFNTALLNNEFMYGNGGYGYNGYAGGYPLAQQNYQYAENNQQSINSDNHTENTPNVEQNTNTEKKKEKKKFKLTKNIDTYRDENTPSLRTKFKSIKESVAGFFNKFRPNKNVENPVYREVISDD